MPTSKSDFLNLAIQATKERQRRLYTGGHAAYLAGVRGVSFAEDGERHWQEHAETIRYLQTLKAIADEEGVISCPQDSQKS